MSQAISRILIDLKMSQLKLDRIILATPTGEKRNALTEVNIHLNESADKLEAVLEKFPTPKRNTEE